MTAVRPEEVPIHQFEVDRSWWSLPHGLDISSGLRSFAGGNVQAGPEYSPIAAFLGPLLRPVEVAMGIVDGYAHDPVEQSNRAIPFLEIAQLRAVGAYCGEAESLAIAPVQVSSRIDDELFAGRGIALGDDVPAVASIEVNGVKPTVLRGVVGSFRVVGGPMLSDDDWQPVYA